MFDDVSKWAAAVQSELVEREESVGILARQRSDKRRNCTRTSRDRERAECWQCLIVAFIRAMRGRLKIHRQLPAAAWQGGLMAVLRRASAAAD